MGHKHSREEILAAALDVARADGLSRVTYGRVAKQLGIADRTVVYYFSTKDELVAAVLVTMGLDLQDRLTRTLTEPVADHLALARAAWPVLAHRDAEPVFALFFEANGLAAAGQEPFATVVPQLVDAWIDWAADHVVGTPAFRRTEAAASIALVDGLLLLRSISGHTVARRAAARLGVT